MLVQLKPRASVLLGLLAFALASRSALALDKDAEAYAKSLQKRAMGEDYLATEFKQAQDKLDKALAACSPDACDPKLRAALRRDLGVVQIGGRLNAARGQDNFAEAMKLDSNVALDRDLETKEIRAAWDAAKNRGKPAEAPKVASSAAAPAAAAPPAAPSTTIPEEATTPGATPDTPEQAATTSTAKRHLGFFLRFDPGVGALSTGATTGGKSVSRGSAGWSTSWAIGGAVREDVILAAHLWNAEGANENRFRLVGFGPSVIGYLPHSFYLSATPSFTVLRVLIDGVDYDTKLGFGGRMGAGKEWWVGDHWELGVGLNLALSGNADEGSTTAPLRAAGATFVSVGGALSFNITYN